MKLGKSSHTAPNNTQTSDSAQQREKLLSRFEQVTLKFGCDLEKYIKRAFLLEFSCICFSAVAKIRSEVSKLSKEQ